MSEQSEYTEYRVVGESDDGEAWDHGLGMLDREVAERRAADIAKYARNRRVAIEARTWTATPWGIATEVKL